MMDTKYMRAIEDLESSGYSIIEDFLSSDELESLKNEFERVVDEHVKQVECGKSKDYQTSNYSSELYEKDELVFFLEDDLVDEDGNLKPNNDRKKSYARVGCSWHTHNKVFREILTSEKFLNLFKALKYGKPMIVSSLVHPKNPKIGSNIEVHRDSWTLYTKPFSKTITLCIALDDATKENGGLELIPDSHKKVMPVECRLIMIRPNYKPFPMLEMQAEGEEFEFDDKEFVNVDVKQGDVMCLDGDSYHRSGPNMSQKRRCMYFMYCIDLAKAKIDSRSYIYNDGPALLVNENKVVKRCF